MSEDKKILDEAARAEAAKVQDAELNEEALDEVSGGGNRVFYVNKCSQYVAARLL